MAPAIEFQVARGWQWVAGGRLRRELAVGRPGMGFGAVVRLGELRRRQGRLDDACVLFDEIEFHSVA